MSTYITIDGGTTNTRLRLVENKTVIDGIKIGIGARAGIDNKHALEKEIKSGIQALLQRNGRCEKDIRCILASGMITSEFGLCHLEHLEAPAGIEQLHRGIYKTALPEITQIPFAFIRGVKIPSESFEDADIMRGEESELMGIMEPWHKKCVYILPGSHSKLIYTDEYGRISKFATMLTGEMIDSLSQHTILKDAVDLGISGTDRAYLLKGYDFCKQAGINKALFKVRLLKNMFHCTPDEIYSYFLGVVLCGEIAQILNCDAETAVIGGKAQIKMAMADILQHRGIKKVLLLDDQTAENAAALGVIRIFEHSSGVEKAVFY